MNERKKNLSKFENSFMVCKEDVMKNIDSIIKDYDRYINNNDDVTHTSNYYKICKNMFVELKNTIKDKQIFCKRDFWLYEFLFFKESLFLRYIYCPNYIYEEHLIKIPPIPTESYILFKVNCKLLSISEFAKLCNTNDVTVRQWIRRGKIKTAKKIGNEWRIPERAEINKMGDIRASYEWDNNKITVFDNEYKYLNMYDGVKIKRDDVNLNKYHIEYFIKDVKNDGYNKIIKTEIMDIKSKEKFEINLMSNENVYSSGEVATLFWRK